MKWSCCQDEVVSECSWYVEDSKERKKQPRRKENRSVWAIKIALSHAHWIYPFTRARVSPVVTARVVTCIWLSEISGVHPWWCVCTLSLWIEVFNCVQADCTTHEETHRRRTCVLALKKVTRYCVQWSALHRGPSSSCLMYQMCLPQHEKMVPTKL